MISDNLVYQKEYIRKYVVPAFLVFLTAYTLYGYVVSLNAFTSPSQELRWDGMINYINKPTFSAGETVSIDGFYEQGETYFSKGQYYFFVASENVRWIIVVKDPTNQPIWFESDQVLNADGDLVVDNITFDLPANAVLGEYSVKLMIWSDWLPSGESRTNIIHETSFEVI